MWGLTTPTLVRAIAIRARTSSAAAPGEEDGAAAAAAGTDGSPTTTTTSSRRRGSDGSAGSAGSAVRRLVQAWREQWLSLHDMRTKDLASLLMYVTGRAVQVDPMKPQVESA